MKEGKLTLQLFILTRSLNQSLLGLEEFQLPHVLGIVKESALPAALEMVLYRFVFLNCGCCLLFFIEPSFTSVISFFLTHMLLNLYSQIWSLKPGWGSRPDVFVGKGHSDDITCLKFSSDGQILLSRSSDCSLKVVMKHSFREYCVFTSLIYVYSRYLSHPSSYLYFHVLGLGFAANERGP